MTEIGEPQARHPGVHASLSVVELLSSTIRRAPLHRKSWRLNITPSDHDSIAGQDADRDIGPRA
jgi:hypothetical protein